MGHPMFGEFHVWATLPTRQPLLSLNQLRLVKHSLTLDCFSGLEQGKNDENSDFRFDRLAIVHEWMTNVVG